MVAASNMAEFADLRHNGLGYLLDLIDRYRIILFDSIRRRVSINSQ